MNQPLLALSNGELLRLSACLRSQPLIPNEAALNQQQIARKNPELRRALLAWLENWNHQGGSYIIVLNNIQNLLRIYIYQ